MRGGLTNKDLGYPSAVPDGEGGVFAVYYCQDAEGVTGIWSSRFVL